MAADPIEALNAAITRYDYPSVTYDFVQHREQRFATMALLDHHLSAALHATDPATIKDALSQILYWGHYRAGYRDHRVQVFRTTVTNEQLRHCITVFGAIKGTSLRELKSIGLPQFSNMAFLTKLQTFLHPETYVVLDKKISTLRPLQERLTIHPTSIPITTNNERAYDWWVNTCATLASRLRTTPTTPSNNNTPTATLYRPVDVERGLFTLIDHGQQTLAETILAIAA